MWIFTDPVLNARKILLFEGSTSGLPKLPSKSCSTWMARASDLIDLVWKRPAVT